MKKHVLLGLLLVPCAAYAMDSTCKIIKNEDDMHVTYTRVMAGGYIEHAVYNKQTGRYIVSATTASRDEVELDVYPDYFFETLSKEHARRQQEKDLVKEKK